MRIKFYRDARSTPDSIDGLKVPYGAAKREAPKWRWRLILLAVLSPAILLAYSAAEKRAHFVGGRLCLPGSIRGASAALRPGRRARGPPRGGGSKGRCGLVSGRAACRRTIATSPQARESASAGRSRTWLLEELALQERALQMQQERAAATEDLVQQGAATAAELREAQVAVNQVQAAVLRVRQQLAPTSDRPVEPNARAHLRSSNASASRSVRLRTVASSTS